MEQSFGEEEVKKEPVDLDYCQDDVIGSLEEQGFPAFVQESQPILVPELGNCEGRPTPENDNQFVKMPSKRKRGPAKKTPAAKRTRNTKKPTTAQRKSDNDKQEDNRELIESTSQSGPSRLHSTMLEEPQDLIIKTDQDNPAHTPVDLPCPPTLQRYTDAKISSAFEKCGAVSRKSSSKLKFTDPTSIFGQVYTLLTKNKKSSLYEREYLHRIWLQKYKPESLKKFSEDQIGTAFLLCYSEQPKLNYLLSNGLFHKVYTFLTENKDSNCVERKYLYDVWTIKYKEALHKPDEKLKKMSKNDRRKAARQLRYRERKRESLVEQTMITQAEEEHPYPTTEMETTFQTEHDDEDDEIPPISPQNPMEQESKPIRIRVKVEVEADHNDCQVSDSSYEGASPVASSPPSPVPDHREPQKEVDKDLDRKLTLKPVIRLTRLNAKKLEQEKEELSKIKSQSKMSSMYTKSRKSVKSTKYHDNSDEDALSVNEGDNDDYIASEQDRNSSDNESDFEIKMNTSNPAKKRTTINSSQGASARAIKRARGRPRIRPKKVKKPRIRNTMFHKLINFRLWGIRKHHKAPNQVPIPLELWQESLGKHAEFIVSNSCDVLKEDLEKTTPTAGKGTFANPHWTRSDEDKEDRMGPLKCVCPACGLTFFEIDELLQHRDETHREYVPMCVVCSRPMGGKSNIAPHLGSHFTKEQLEQLLEEEMALLGAQPEGCSYRLVKCEICCKICVGAKSFTGHMDVHLKVKKKSKNKGKNYTNKPVSFIKRHKPETNVFSECKVCGMPLSSEFMSFHLRTHLNSEEQKEYLKEQQSKMKKMRNVIIERNIPGKDRTDVRIDQLKNLLEALQRRNGKEITKWPKPNEIIKKERGNVKRDGNYGPVQCATCGKVIATVYSLRAHEIAQHEGEKKFECRICHRPFGLKQLVSSHIPTHFNLEEQEKYSVWKGSVWEFVERLNSGEDLNKPPSSRRGRKMTKERRSIKNKKIGRPRKHHHLYKDNVYQVGVQSGGQPSFYGGAASTVLTRNLEGAIVAEEKSSTSTFSSAGSTE